MNDKGCRIELGAANNATDCDLENYSRAFWAFRHTRKRKQRFENGIGKAYENEPKLYSRVNVAGGPIYLLLIHLH
jgi:hypothetical protein